MPATTTKITRLLIFSLALVSFALAQTAAAPPRTIHVVVDNAYAPYSFQTEDGKLQGILIDQWQAWEKKTGIKAEIHAMDWGEALRHMRAGEFDVIESIIDTPEREVYFDFTPPYTTVEASIYFRNDISGISNIASLQGFPVGVKTGDKHIAQLKANGVTTVVEFQNNDAVIEAAKQHKINVFVVDDPSALYLLNKSGIQEEFRRSAPVFRDDLRRAVRNGDAATMRLVQEGFTAIDASELKQIDEKWYGRPINSYGRYIIDAGYAAAIAVLLIAGLATWNRTLRKKILQRTAALGESEQRFRQIAENLREVFWLRTADLSTVLYISPAYDKVWGRSRESVYLDPNEFVAAIHPEDRAEVLALGPQDLEQGFEVEYRVVRPDGSIRWVRDRGFPITDKSGHFYRVAGIAEDITERKQAEDALRRSEDRIRLIIDTIPTMAWSIRPDGVIEFVNQRWLDYTGLSLEEEIEKPTLPMHPADLASAMEKWGANMAAGEPSEDEMRLRRADGEYRWFLIRTAPLRDEQGNVVKWYGVSIDIEDRKQAEEALDERLRFETMVTELSATFANLSPNEVDREIDNWLQTLAAFLGVDRASFLQFGDDWTTLYRSHSYTVPGVEPLPPPPTGLKDPFPWITDQLRRGVTVNWSRIPDDMAEDAVNEKEYAARIGVKSGLSIPVLMGGSVICAISFTSILTYHDWPEAMVARLRLVGEIFAAAVERKRAEGALREAEQKYREIFANAGEGIFQSTPDGRYIEANPTLARMYGFSSPEELINSRQDISLQVYVDPARRDEFKRQLEEQGAVRAFEHKVFRKDGTTLWISVNARAVQDEHGKIAYYEGTASDITERKAAEEKLKATSDQLRALSAKLSSAREEESIRIAREIHDELGSMLTTLKWDLEEIQKTLSAPVHQPQLASVREKLTALTKLTDMSVSTLRRIASELRPSVLDDLGLAPAIEWQAQQFQARTGIICDCDCNSGLENIQLSAEQSTAVFRIFQEALTNVLRHARATRVDVQLQTNDGILVLSVKDNGKGISDNGKSEQQSLGLLGMRERAHLIGGEVSIARAEGHGTVVTLRVPIAGREIVRTMTK
ncbi:MAG TPA: hypothetical protein DC047_02865 [Blastocatellia bacterium]|nr:hypothetical protein [Blastocatellia bacterium]